MATSFRVSLCPNPRSRNASELLEHDFGSQASIDGVRGNDKAVCYCPISVSHL